jgi:hypothetical protein
VAKVGQIRWPNTQETTEFIEEVRKTNPESADIIARYMNMKL